MREVSGNTCYWLDSDDRIIKVCDQWDQFAHQNGGHRAMADCVIGQPLWQFLVGDETRMWVETVLKRVRFMGEAIERPYRCDSEETQRHMRLNVTPLENNQLCLESTLVSTCLKKRPVIFSTHYGNTVLSKRCSICGRVQYNHQWIEADEIDLDHNSPLDCLVIYGVCEDCVSLARFKPISMPA